jgi:hypothetical protein
MCGSESMENPTQVARESMHNPMQVAPRSMARSQITGERRRWREERRAYGIHGGSEKLLSGSRQAGDEGDAIFLLGICGARRWAYQTRHQVVPAGIRYSPSCIETVSIIPENAAQILKPGGTVDSTPTPTGAGRIAVLEGDSPVRLHGSATSAHADGPCCL